MAKYIGSLTTDARGKHAGTVFTRGRSGTVLKGHGVPVQTRSPYQLSLRSSFAAAIAAWRAMTSTDQTTWALLAVQYTWLNSLAQTYSPTALQLWTQAFVTARLSSSTPSTTAPTSPPSIEPITGMTAIQVSGNLLLGAQMSGGFPYPGCWSLSLSSPISSSIQYAGSIRRRPIGAVLLDSTINGTAPYIAAYGALPGVDTKLSFRAVPFDLDSFLTGTIFAGTLFVT